MNYEIIESPYGAAVIKRTDEDGTVWFIPTDLANSDYQAYLAEQDTESAPDTL